jgi:hypothetical protein
MTTTRNDGTTPTKQLRGNAMQRKYWVVVSIADGVTEVLEVFSDSPKDAMDYGDRWDSLGIAIAVFDREPVAWWRSEGWRDK